MLFIAPVLFLSLLVVVVMVWALFRPADEVVVVVESTWYMTSQNEFWQYIGIAEYISIDSGEGTPNVFHSVSEIAPRRISRCVLQCVVCCVVLCFRPVRKKALIGNVSSLVKRWKGFFDEIDIQIYYEGGVFEENVPEAPAERNAQSLSSFLSLK